VLARRRSALAVIPLLAAALGMGSLTALPAMAAAAAPEGLSPTSGDTVGPTPAFAWQKAAGAVKYRFQVSTSPGFTGNAYDVTTYGLHATPPTALPAGPMYWHVGAVDTSNIITWSDTVNFSVSTTSGPTLVSPADGESLDYPVEAPVLVWDPVLGAKGYVVEIDDNESFTSPAQTNTANSQLALTEPPPLTAPQYWRVKGTLGTNIYTDWSATRSFTMAWPGAPVPQFPGESATVGHLGFSWSNVPGAKTYELQLSPNADFSSPVTLDGGTAIRGTHYTPPTTQKPQGYFWRVRAKDNAISQHPGPWSSTATFTLSLIAAPTNLSPGLDVNQAGPPPALTQPKLSWSGVSRASTYIVEIGTDQNFSPSTYSTCTTNHTTLTPFLSGSSLPCNIRFSADRYFWRVYGKNVYDGAPSAVMSFFYHRPAPQVTGPAEGSTVTAPVLSWEPVDGYNKYRVRLQKAGSSSVATKDTYSTSYTPVGSSLTALGIGPGTYTWTVRTVDANGDEGPVDGTHSYVLEAPAAGGTLSTIAPDATSSIPMPPMSWNPQDGAESYVVWYRAAGGPTYISLSGSQLIHHHAFTSYDEPLPPGQYEWWVEAKATGGASLGSSDVKTFTITDQPRATHTAPLNCQVELVCPDHTDVPTLEWDLVPGTYHYRVHLSTDPQFANEETVRTTQLTSITFPETLADNQAQNSYYWFIQPCKSPTVCGPFSNGITTYEQSFRKKTPPVQLISPADGATVGDDPQMTWQEYLPTVDDTPVATARKYHFQVATDAGFVNIVEQADVDGISFTPYKKEYADGTYFWRVWAVDGDAHALTSSETRSFVKLSDVPVLDNVGTTTPLPTLTWEALGFVGSYQVEIYPGLTTNVAQAVNTTTKLPAYTPSVGLAKGTYTWRVAKKDADGNRGPWSATKTFNVAVSAPGLLTPVDQASIASDDLVFSWTGVPSAAQYRFESSTSSSFGSFFEQQPVAGTQWASPKKYVDGTKYYWRVVVLDSKSPANVLATSATRWFVKDSARPTVLSVLPTTNVALTGNAVTATFSEAVKGVNTTTLKVHQKGASSLVVAGSVTMSADKKVATFKPSSPLVPGRWYTVVLSSSITDLVGNPLVAASFDRRAALIVDSSSSVVREYWDIDTSSSASSGAFATSKLVGAAMSLSFTGTSVQVVGTKGPLGGYANVYVDGVLAGKPSFYRSSTAYQQVVFTKSGMTNAVHTIKVVVVGGTPPTGSKGTYVYVDAFKVGTSVFQESSARHTFSRVTTSLASGGSYDREWFDPSGDTSVKPEYRLVFDGSGVDLYTVRSNASGKARVYVDGVFKGDVDLYSGSTGYKFRSLAVTGLATTKVHTLRLIFLGTKNTSSTGYAVQLDGFVVK